MLKKLMIGLAIITMLFIAGCSLDQAPLSPQEEEITPTQTQTDRYGPATRVKLWQATFNGTGLPGAWTFQTGGGGWGNNELQCYTNRTVNVNCANGYVTIQARKENYGGCAYTSARLNSKFSRRYGFIEARMRVPMGQGLWPAFWALGTNIGSVGWPGCGEIDIMEHINNQGTVYGTIHWDAGGHASYGGSYNCSPGQWNKYAIWWTPNFIRWFVNGNRYWEANIQNSINSTEEFHRPFYLLLNLAVGGDWPGSPNSATAFPAKFQIDWVRWFRE